MSSLQDKALRAFVSDPILYPLVMETVKRKAQERKEQIISRIMSYPNLPTPLTETNEEVGAQLRAIAEGIHLVETIFRELGQSGDTSKPELTKNPAR